MLYSLFLAATCKCKQRNDLSYNIILPQFEGPFDLLLFFIERDELDIYDIPINTLTTDFLSYIKRMEKLNIDVASEFILVAATLMKIKSRMLIPKKEVDEAGNEIDPREELILKLIEYKKFKAVIQDLVALENSRQNKNKRGNIHKELKKIAEINSTEAELESLTLYKLMRVFDKVMKRYVDRNTKIEHTVVRYNYTIANQKDHIRKLIYKRGNLHFKDAFEHLENRVHAVFTFLAVLEMVQLNDVQLQVGEGMNNFWLKAA